MTREWVVSAFTRVSWTGRRVELTSTTSGISFVSEDLELVHLVHLFAQPLTIDAAVRKLDPPVAELVRNRISDLIRAGILTAADEREEAVMHHWDDATLAYHRHARQPLVVSHSDSESRTAAPEDPRSWIPLARGGADEGSSLAHVLETRRSRREWNDRPVTFEALSRVLWLSARNRDDSTGSVSRPYPSGGAVYSLNVYAVVGADAVTTVGPGVYKYLPDCHGLALVSSDVGYVPAFLEAARRSAGARSAPPIVLLITSRFREPGGRYGNVAYSLVLKEVGCLFQTLYLAAEAVGLGACALGGGSPAGTLARLIRTTEVAEPVVGEFALGPR
jgi:SagB-type dehydrogenase family enzyme